jgi:hypothetical protein
MGLKIRLEMKGLKKCPEGNPEECLIQKKIFPRSRKDLNSLLKMLKVAFVS